MREDGIAGGKGLRYRLVYGALSGVCFWMKLVHDLKELPVSGRLLCLLGYKDIQNSAVPPVPSVPQLPKLLCGSRRSERGALKPLFFNLTDQLFAAEINTQQTDDFERHETSRGRS